MAWPKGTPRKAEKVIKNINILDAYDFKKANLKEIVDGMKSLLKTFQYDLNIAFEENNGILSAIKIEIKIKNLR